LEVKPFHPRQKLSFNSAGDAGLMRLELQALGSQAAHRLATRLAAR